MILSVFFRIFPFIQNPSSAGYSFVSGKKVYALLVPPRICQTYAQKALWAKVIPSKGGKSKVYNLTLMNILIKAPSDLVTRYMNGHLHTEMSVKHFGDQRRRASGNNPDNPSSFVPYHHRRPIRPAKIPDQGLSLRLRHVWKSWGAGPGNEVAVPSRKEDNRVPFLARSFFRGDTGPGVTTMHLPCFRLL